MLSSKTVLVVMGLLFGLSNPVLSVTVRINALGESITGSPGCWRALLWQMLQNAGVTNTTFVGTLPAQGCGFYYDGANDGHGGYLATDIVIMELGTNDVWNNIATSTVLAAFSTLVDQMRVQKPTMRILVAQITPMNPTNCAACAQGVINLNNAIPAWAANKTTSASPVTVVDCWTGYDDATDTVDGVHPNSSGNQKLANAWFTLLKNVIIAASGGSPATTTTSTPTKTTVGSGASISSSSKAVTSSANAGGTAPVWGQCGGQGWTGPIACANGSKCTYSNPWYSQCLPS